MSRFLGPIHNWLFNKIKLHEKLEEDIIENLKRYFGDSILEMAEEVRKTFGNPLEDKPLEELIDTDNIHGWLQSRISIAETRQAALITKAIKRYGDNGLDIIKESYKEQGAISGRDAREKYDLSKAEDLYRALNNYILDGMPCDNVNNITVNEEDKLEWRVYNCLHKAYWEKVDGDLDILYALRKIWIENFIKEGNPKFKYDFYKERINGNIVLIHEISKY